MDFFKKVVLFQYIIAIPQTDLCVFLPVNIESPAKKNKKMPIL
jgi:hypothetical protein